MQNENATQMVENRKIVCLKKILSVSRKYVNKDAGLCFPLKNEQ